MSDDGWLRHIFIKRGHRPPHLDAGPPPKYCPLCGARRRGDKPDGLVRYWCETELYTWDANGQREWRATPGSLCRAGRDV